MGAQWHVRQHAQSVLRPIIVHRRGTRYAGGVSRIVKLMTANNRHVGTLHEIAMPDGAVPHSHPKDYTRRDCSRVGGPREQAAARGAP